MSAETALLALQGPAAFGIAQALTDVPLGDLKYYHFMELADGAFAGLDYVLLSATGYTGERGLEIYCDADDARAVWNALLEAGAGDGLVPAGLGARDTLRLEAGYCLYGQDLTRQTNPLEAGLGWVVKPGASAFVGRDALALIQEHGGPRAAARRLHGRRPRHPARRLPHRPARRRQGNRRSHQRHAVAHAAPRHRPRLRPQRPRLHDRRRAPEHRRTPSASRYGR